MVVGRSWVTGDAGYRAFAYDLRTDTEMRDLGTLGGSTSWAAAVDGDLVVGQSFLAGDGAFHPFAHDLATGTTFDLGLPADRTNGTAVAVSGEVVAGVATTEDGVSQATAWRIDGAGPSVTETVVASSSGPAVVGSTVTWTATVSPAPSGRWLDRLRRRRCRRGRLRGPSGRSRHRCRHPLHDRGRGRGVARDRHLLGRAGRDGEHVGGARAAGLLRRGGPVVAGGAAVGCDRAGAVPHRRCRRAEPLVPPGAGDGDGRVV